MKQVGVAELKAHLSEHLRAVRGGQPLVVVDRSTPVARIVPVAGRDAGLTVEPARRSLEDVELPPPLGTRVDVVALLRAERHES